MQSVRCTIACSSVASRRRRNPLAESSFPTRPRKSRRKAKIIAVGPGGRDEAGKLIPIDIEVGDRVLFGKWSGTEVKIDGEELIVMKETDIMGNHRRAGDQKQGCVTRCCMLGTLSRPACGHASDFGET